MFSAEEAYIILLDKLAGPQYKCQLRHQLLHFVEHFILLTI